MHAGIAQVRVQNSRPSVVVVLILPTTQATFDAHYDQVQLEKLEMDTIMYFQLCDGMC